jgi:hypothetical protein
LGRTNLASEHDAGLKRKFSHELVRNRYVVCSGAKVVGGPTKDSGVWGFFQKCRASSCAASGELIADLIENELAPCEVGTKSQTALYRQAENLAERELLELIDEERGGRFGIGRRGRH